LLPAAWATLVALVVLEEPLVGDRSFWITRPIPRSSLAADKLLFTLIAIHLPLFIASCFILASHYFNPLEHVGTLLVQQAAVFAIITLPALALAALVRNFAQFVIVLLAIASAVAFANIGLQSFPTMGGPDVIRPQLIRLVLVLASATVIIIQYARRNAG